MAKLVLELQLGKQLLVTGQTFDVKEFLKEQGGRWDSIAKGWTFAVGEAGLIETKQALTSALRASKLITSIDDKAYAKCGVQTALDGVLVLGDTYVLKEWMKSQGFVWKPELKGWFHASEKAAAVSRLLQKTGAVEVSQRECCTELVVQTPDKIKRKVPPESTEKRQLVVRERPAPLARSALATKGQKVTETAKATNKKEVAPDGSTTFTKKEQRQKKLKCKETGTAVSQSVTKTSKVQNKRGKIIETTSVVVKKIRSK